MDIQRPELMLRKRRRRSWWIGVTVSLVSATGIGVARMDPAMPTVQRSMLLVGTVERGEMLREVRGPGTLVPREIRWIAAETAARVERIVAKPGARVRPDGVILELVNPEVDEQLLAATAALTTAQSDAAARSTELSSRLYDAQAALEQARSGFEAARMQAEAEKDVADKGIIPAVQYRRSLVVLEQLRKRVDIEERRVLAFERSISAQVAGEQARLDQLAATRALRQRQVDGLRVRARRERRAAVEGHRGDGFRRAQLRRRWSARSRQSRRAALDRWRRR
jgi:HlyD family secretion protein